MYLDEKIALMERARRQKEKEELAENKETVPEEEKLTLEDALKGIHEGMLVLSEKEHLEFETRICSEKKIPMVIFKDFYEAVQEEEEGTIFVNHAKGISQILSWPKGQMKPVNFKQWENMLVNGMASNNMYAKPQKKKQLEHMEYICFDVPTGEGWLYNIVFRPKGKKQFLIGNYNCKKEEKDTYGVILEAMVMAMNEWFAERERGDIFGEQ